MTVTSLVDGGGWLVDGITFTTGYGLGSTPDRFLIRKPAALFERYVELADRFRGGHLVELGIAAGGSTALLSLLAAPRSLTALELDPESVTALVEFIGARGLSSVVRPHHGVDQADRERVAALVDSSRADEPIDLVIDDASHRYHETLASFEVLFPRLRPGGWYIIEDWAADYAYADRISAVDSDTSPEAAAMRRRLDEAVAAQAGRPEPLPRIGVELLHACGASGDVVHQLTIDRHWIVAERGGRALDHHAFRLSDHCPDHWGWLRPIPP